MEHLRTHFFVFLAITIGCILIIAAIVFTHQPQSSSTQQKGWGSAVPTPVTPVQYNQQEFNPGQQTHEDDYTPITLVFATTASQTLQQPDTSLDDLLSALSHPTNSKPASSTGTTTSFEMIPSTLLATSQAVPTLSATQKALKTYGNSAGSIISTYEQSHLSTIDTLTNAFKNRTDSSSAQSVEQIGKDLKNVGSLLQDMHPIPTEVDGAHQSLAQSFIEAGDALIKVAHAQTQSDNTYLTAMRTYNTKTLSYIRAVTALALTFSLHNITFDTSEPGSLFMFSSAGH